MNIARFIPGYGAYRRYRHKAELARYKAGLLEAHLERQKNLVHRYKAAQASRLDGNWFPSGTNTNQLIGASLPLMRARVREMVRNFPPFARAINASVAFTVGDGAIFQSMVTYEDGTPNNPLRQKIESRFRDWMDNCDIAEKLCFYEIQQLAKRQMLENGEYIIRFVQRRGRKRGLALQVHDAEDLSTLLINNSKGDTAIFQGIEYEKLTGRPVRYYFQSSAGLSNDLDVWTEQPENVLHGFHTLRPGQLRGVTPLAPAIITAKDMDDYTMSELDSAKMAAKWLGFVTTPTPDEFQFARGMRPPSASAQPSASGPAQQDGIEDLENAILEYLRDGEKVEFAPSSARPGDSFERFTRHAQRMIAIVAPLTYELLSGDYTGLNYTVSKSSRNDFLQLLKPEKRYLQQHLVTPVFHKWLDSEALTQDYLPGYFSNPSFYRKGHFVMPGMPSIDPLREGKADIDKINAGLTSPQEVIMARGGDPETVLNDIVKWREMCEARGLDFTGLIAGIDTTLSNNPAKLGAEEFEG